MTFEEFEKLWFNDKRPEFIRKGQNLMILLNKVWPKEYQRISSIDGTSYFDCFYRDDLVRNTLKHLESVWHNYPN